MASVRSGQRPLTFAAIRALARELPDVEPARMYGAPALELGGRFLACMATNKAAEPNTLVVAVGFEQRDALVASAPETYYLKDHYADYPVVLVRLSRIRTDALQALLREAWHFVHAQPVSRKRALKRVRRTRR
jgi:hypothetical protein